MRTVYVPDGVTVQLAEPVAARIYVRDSTGNWVKGSNRVLLPEGAYVKTLRTTPSATEPSR